MYTANATDGFPSYSYRWFIDGDSVTIGGAAQALRSITNARSSESLEAGMDIPNRLLRVLGMGVVVVLAIAGTACGSITDSADEVRQVGVIGPVADAQVVIPDTVQVGVESVVEVTTFGSPCFRKGETEVEHAANTVTITPYDYPHARESCFSIEISFVHRATVEFSEPGLTSVVIVGRARATEDEVVEVAREVVVVEGQAPN